MISEMCDREKTKPSPNVLSNFNNCSTGSMWARLDRTVINLSVGAVGDWVRLMIMQNNV